MSSAATPSNPKKLTSQEYLAIERRAEFKSEFYNGEMFAMAGASRVHTRIKDNFGRKLADRLEDQNCEVLTSDQRVRVNKTGLYVYPDIVVTCAKPQFEDKVLDTLLNPQVIVEVLSDSTASYDRGTKFNHYRQIESLKEYILVAQDRPVIERFVRASTGDQWTRTEFSGIDQVVSLGSLDVRVPLSEIYRGIEFSEEPLR